MTTCKTARQSISDTLDAGGSAPADVRRHIAACAGCQSFEEGASSLDSLLARPVTSAPFPESAHRAIMSSVSSGAPGEAGGKVVTLRRWFGPLAAAAAVVVAAVLLWPERPGDEGRTIVEVTPSPEAGAKTGLTSSFEVPLDLNGFAVELERRVNGAFAEGGGAIVADVGKVGQFFGSRLNVIQRIGL